MYVKNLEILAQKLDEHYQLECKEALAPVIAQIASEDEDAGYHRGPVKGLPRMNEKLAEYVEEGKPFPRAACVIDVLRNSVAFDSAGQILAAFKLLEAHEGLQLVRYKNKYHADSLWNGAPPPFRAYLVSLVSEFPNSTHVCLYENFCKLCY